MIMFCVTSGFEAGCNVFLINISSIIIVMIMMLIIVIIIILLCCC